MEYTYWFANCIRMILNIGTELQIFKNQIYL